jgi:hypothetical protein
VLTAQSASVTAVASTGTRPKFIQGFQTSSGLKIAGDYWDAFADMAEGASIRAFLDQDSNHVTCLGVAMGMPEANFSSVGFVRVFFVFPLETPTLPEVYLRVVLPPTSVSLKISR